MTTVVSPSAKSASVWNIRALFLCEAVVLTSIFPRFPDLKETLALDHAQLGLSLLGLPLGTLLSLILAGGLVDRLGTRRASLIGISLVAISMVLPTLAVSMMALFVALFVVGLSLALIEIGMNVDADRVEKWVSKPIMSSCHGFWSVGALIGTGLGALCAGMGISPLQQIMIISPIFGIAGILIIQLRTPIPVPPPSAQLAPTFALPTRALLGVAVFAVGLQMSEGAAFDWSGIYMREVVGANATFIGMAYFSFTLPMAIGRFFGDHFRTVLGPVRLARITTLIGCLGLLILGLTETAIGSILAWGLVGLGASMAFPLAVTAAAERDDRPAAVNVASVFLVAFTAFVIGPPLIGFVAKLVGLQNGLMALLPFCILGYFLAPSLKPK
ncbi:MAG: MFS transporter [Alphaproteobacteria bacterium]|nr:MFS transporter [Alphaproteobacteria bacterium]